MRGSRLVLALLVVAAFLLVLWKTQPPSAPTAPGPSQAPPSVVPAIPVHAAMPEAPRVASVPPEPEPAVSRPLTRSGLPMPPPAPAEQAEAERDLLQVQLMLRQFRDVLGENPIGNNAEIMSAVRGQNLRQARIGAPEGMVLNADGELLDRWGTPYFFHAVSKDEMEVRSAGPDRILWTGDDVKL
jgi:hypothetical protein